MRLMSHIGAQLSQVIAQVTAPSFLLGAVAAFISVLIARMKRARDGEQMGDLGGIDSRTNDLDEEATVGQCADARPAALVERVIGNLLDHQPGELVPGHPGLLLKPLDGAEE